MFTSSNPAYFQPSCDVPDKLGKQLELDNGRYKQQTTILTGIRPSAAPPTKQTPKTDAQISADNTPSTTTDLYNDALDFFLSEIFTKSLLVSLTSKDAVLKK